MKTTAHLVAPWLMVCLCLMTSAHVTAEEDSITVDPNTGDYIIKYRGFIRPGQPEVWHRVVFIPATKINPSIKSEMVIKDPEHGVLVYRYKFTNGRDSRQALEGERFNVSNANSNTQMTPHDWKGLITPDYRSTGFLVAWSFNGVESLGGLKPGKTQSGFGFESTDLSGVGTIELWGAAPAAQGFPDEGPDELSPIRDKFTTLTNEDFVTRRAAVPQIIVPDPFDAAVVLTNLQRHIDQDLIKMKLIDSVLVTQLDRLFLAAIDAAKRNNISGLRNNLKDIRQVLKEEHEDIDKDEDEDKDENQKAKSSAIDKLAAKVLDFDVKYVLKRIGDGEPEKRNPPSPALGPPR